VVDCFFFMFSVLIFLVLLLDYFSVPDTRRKYSIVLWKQNNGRNIQHCADKCNKVPVYSLSCKPQHSFTATLFVHVLVFDISVVKESQTCYFYCFSGPKRPWLRNLRIMKMCRLVVVSHIIKLWLNSWMLLDCLTIET